MKKWQEQYLHSLNGKTVAITGATGGLGQEICRETARLGGSLILLDRNPEKDKILIQNLRAINPKGSFRSIRTDLSDMNSVRETCEQLKTIPFDILIHNAGVYKVPRKICSTGFNSVFQINFVSPYYMTRKLADTITARHGKVIAVGSIAHNYSRTDPADTDFSSRKACSLVYGNSKRYLMYALWGLKEKYPELDLVIAHPGVTVTNMTAHFPKTVYAVIRWPMKLVLMKPKKAIRGILRGMFEQIPANFWIGPYVFNTWGSPKISEVRTASPEEKSRIVRTAEEVFETLDH